MGIELVIIAVLLVIIAAIVLSTRKIKMDRQARRHKSIPDEPDRNENAF